MPKVVVTGPDQVSREFEIDRDLTLGRHASNEIQIVEEKASRRHCRFRPANGAVIVEDLDSSNGTKVNGRKVAQQALKHGDVIAIGQFTISFQDQENRLDRTMVLPEVSDADVERAKAAQKAQRDRPTAQRIPAMVRIQQQEERTEPEIQIKPLDEEKWSAERAPQKHDHDPKVIARYVAYGLAGIVILAVALKLRPTSTPEDLSAPVAVASKEEPAPVAPPIVETAATSTVETPPAPEIPAVPVKAPIVIPPKDPSVLAPPRLTTTPAPVPTEKTDFAADLTKVLADRDRALGTGNYAGARAALNQFIANCTDKTVTQRAQQELKSTDQVIETALEASLNEARQAAASRKYRLATQICTRLMALDATGRFGTESRAILTRIDETAAPRFKDLDTAIEGFIRARQLDRASQSLEAALDELGGTRWAEPVSTQQLQVLMARGLIRKMDEARAKLSVGGKQITVSLPSRKVNGTLMKVTASGADLRASGVALSVPFKDMSPVDFESLQKALGGGNETALEEAYFWQLYGRDPLAQMALERALQTPERAALAMRLVSLLPGQQNLRIYDFSKWQHQSEWDALSGSWSTANDRYVLESPEGGDTALRVNESTALSAKNLRASFDFELIQPQASAYCAFEFGTEQRAVSLIFAQDSITLHANLDGATSEKQPWKMAAAHVDLVFNRESVEVVVNGEKLPPLAVPGLTELRGTVLFRVRDSAAAIDNVVLRNAAAQ